MFVNHGGRLMGIAEQLRSALKGQGETLYAVAKAAGVDLGALSQFAKGQRRMNLDTIDHLAPVLRLELVTRARSLPAGLFKGISVKLLNKIDDWKESLGLPRDTCLSQVD